MKSKYLLLFVLCVLACGQSPAQEMDKELSDMASKLATLTKDNGKKKVAVLDFSDLQGGANDLGKYVAEQLTVDMVMVKKDFSVVDRANLRKILEEHKLTASGLVEPENAKKLGMFAGVDALILGTVTPKNQKISVTAKIISTDTAEIVGAAKAEFKADESTAELLSHAPAATGNANQSSPPPKPFGDLKVMTESLKLLAPTSPGFLVAKLTLVITNQSATQTYGVAIEPDFYQKFNLSNSHGDEFRATEVTGIDTAFDHNDGRFQGSLTDIAPKGSITIVATSQLVGYGKTGDFRPYRLQTVVIWGPEKDGRHSDLKKYNLVMDIK